MLDFLLYLHKESLLDQMGTSNTICHLVHALPLPFKTAEVSVWWGSTCSGGKLTIAFSRTILKSVVPYYRRSLFKIVMHSSQI